MEPIQSNQKMEGSSLIDQEMAHSNQGEMPPSTGLQIRPEEANNAPLEIKQKNEGVVNQNISVGEKKPDEVLEKRKKQVQQCAVKLFKQVKLGCEKDICFSSYCKKNPFMKKEFEMFSDDKSILLHVTKVLLKT